MKLLYHNGRKTEGKKTQPDKNEKTTIEFIRQFHEFFKYEFTNSFYKMNAVYSSTYKFYFFYYYVFLDTKSPFLKQNKYVLKLFQPIMLCAVFRYEISKKSSYFTLS